MIGNLQLLRGLAALGVVFYHTDFRLPGDWHTDFFGVSTFFVISGFIMCFITREDADGFLMKRAIRIVPLYWLCTFTLIVMFDWPYTYPWLLRSMVFYPPEPAGTFPILGVGWTLNFEVYFYAVFAGALLISQRLAPLIAAGVVYAVIKANDCGIDNWLIQFYSHAYIHYFLYGIGLFYVWTLTKDYMPKWPTAAVCAAIIIACYGSQFVTPFLRTNHPSLFNLEIYCPVLVVAASLFAASSGADIKWRPLALMGDASYAIYLSHTIVMEWIRRHIPSASPWKESVGVTIAVIIGATLIGIAVHLWIERPLLRFVRRKLSAPALNAVVTPSTAR